MAEVCVAAIATAVSVIARAGDGDSVHVRAALERAKAAAEAVVAPDAQLCKTTSSFMATLITHVYPRWLPLFPSGEKERLYEALLQLPWLPPVDQVLGVCAALNTSADVAVATVVVTEAARVLQRLLAAECVTAAIIAAPSVEPRWSAFVSALLNAPTAICNVLQTRAPLVFNAARFAETVVAQLLAACNQCGSVTASAAALLTAICRRGHVEQLCAGIVQVAPGWQPTLVAAVLHAVPHVHKTSSMKLILAALNSGKLSGRCLCQSSAQPWLTVAEWYEPLATAMVQLVPRMALQQAVVDALLELTSKRLVPAAFLELCTRYVELWSSGAYIGKTQAAEAKTLTAVVCNAIQRHSAMDVQSRFFTLIITGVQARFSTEVKFHRYHGQQVATAMSKVLSPDAPLAFAETEEGSEPIVETKTEAEATVPVQHVAVETAKVDLEDLVPLDPFMIVPQDGWDTADLSEWQPPAQSVEQVQDSDDSDAESSLQPYAMVRGCAGSAVSDGAQRAQPDESAANTTRTKIPPLVYVSQVVNALKNKEDVEIVKAALARLPVLLEELSAPGPSSHELDLHAAQFARSLLFLDDHFMLPGFQEARRSGICKLLQLRPLLVVPMLAAKLSESEVQRIQRVEVLDMMANVAQAMSSAVPLKPASDTGDSSSVVSRPRGTVLRRWGKARPQSSAPNQFEPYAGAFFYPLAHAIETAPIMERDALLLGHTLRVCAVILEAARFSQAVPSIAQRLLTIVWVLRFHDESLVRQGVLVALTSVVRAVARQSLTELTDAVTEALRWAASLQHTDHDAECRRMAHVLAGGTDTSKYLE